MAGVLTLAIAVWGAITGTIAWRENREISVDVTAETFSGFSSLGQLGIGTDQIRVSVVNTSSRGVTLVSGDVLYRETLAGHVVGVTADAAGAGSTGSTPLPYTVAANTSARLRLDWRVDPGAQRPLAAALTVPVAQRAMSLRTTFEPGGRRTVPIRAGQQEPFISGWTPWLMLHGNAVAKLILIPAARSSGPAIATLRVWANNSPGGRPALTLQRPAAWQLAAFFDVSSLSPGTYSYTMAANGQVVAAGTIRTSCTGPDGSYAATVCSDGVANEAKPFNLPASPTPAGG